MSPCSPSELRKILLLGRQSSWSHGGSIMLFWAVLTIESKLNQVEHSSFHLTWQNLTVPSLGVAYDKSISQNKVIFNDLLILTILKKKTVGLNRTWLRFPYVNILCRNGLAEMIHSQSPSRKAERQARTARRKDPPSFMVCSPVLTMAREHKCGSTNVLEILQRTTEQGAVTPCISIGNILCKHMQVFF